MVVQNLRCSVYLVWTGILLFCVWTTSVHCLLVNSDVVCLTIHKANLKVEGSDLYINQVVDHLFV